MQKKPQIILFLFMFLVHILSAKHDFLLKKATQLYENEEFAAAKVLYDSLYRMGEYDKKILEKLVDISEKNNQQAEAIYFLHKIAQEYGGQEVEKRINTLVEQLDYRHGVTIMDNHFFGFWLKRNQIVFWILILLGISGGFYCLWGKRISDLRKYTYLFFLFSGVLAFAMLYANLGVGKRAILIYPTGFYQAPAYASSYQAEIFAPGSILEIREERDIWYKILANGREFWIPKLRVREL